ncbi:MAG: family 16 glycoside hydrolase [Pirellulales bacterium]
MSTLILLCDAKTLQAGPRDLEPATKTASPAREMERHGDHGDRMTVDLNGHRVIDQAQLPGVPARGPIGLQHEHGTLEFRNLSIRELEQKAP